MHLSNPQQFTSVSFHLAQSYFQRHWMSLFFWLFMAGLNLYPTVHAETSWTDVSAQAQIDVSTPIRSRRSPDAQVKFKITNNGGSELSGPLRLVIVGLTPDTVTLGGSPVLPQTVMPMSTWELTFLLPWRQVKSAMNSN